MNEEPRQSTTSGQDPDWDAIARVIAGESVPAEVVAVQQWLATHPEDAALVASVKDHGDAAERRAAASVNIEAALASVRARLNDQPLRVVPGAITAATSSASTGAAQRRQWGRTVAAIAAGLVIVFGVRQFTGGGSAGSSERVLATAVGQRDSVQLSDGTRIVLAPGSRLVVAANYDAGAREVTLDGAAYFDVHHDDRRPFTVRAGDAVMRDLGTAFTVKTDADGGVAVAVTHGTVALERSVPDSSGAVVELHAGDRGTVSGGAVAVTRGVVTAEVADWTTGRLSYRDAPLAEVQADLRRWFGMVVQVDDAALSRLSVTMPAQADSSIIVKTLAALLGATVEQRGDTVILHSAGSGKKP